MSLLAIKGYIPWCGVGGYTSTCASKRTSSDVHFALCVVIQNFLCVYRTPVYWYSFALLVSTSLSLRISDPERHGGPPSPPYLSTLVRVYGEESSAL